MNTNTAKVIQWIPPQQETMTDEEILALAQEDFGLDHQIEAIKREISEKQITIATLGNRKAEIRQRIKDAMMARDLKRLKDDVGRHTLSLVGGKDKITIVNEAELAKNFWKFEKKVDKAKLNGHYKSTGEIPAGCDIEHGEPELRIAHK